MANDWSAMQHQGSAIVLVEAGKALQGGGVGAATGITGGALLALPILLLSLLARRRRRR